MSVFKMIYNFPITGLTPTNVSYTEQDMGDASISLSIKVPEDVTPDFNVNWTVDFRGETFRLKTLSPPGKKDQSSLLYHYDLTFSSERELLKHHFFASFVQLADGSLQIISHSIPFQGDLTEFVGRFNQNLSYQFGTAWRMSLNPNFKVNPERITVSTDRTTLWDMLTQLYDLYQVRWYIKKEADAMVIYVGYLADEINHIFEYGLDDQGAPQGLVSVQRINPLAEIYTRLYGRGGTRNVPHRYFKGPADGFPGDPDYNSNLQTGYFPNILPSSTRQYVKGWNDAAAGRTQDPDPAWPTYYNLGFWDQSVGRKMMLPNYAQSANIDKWGIREGSVDDNEDVYPSIQGVWLGAIGRADEIVAVEAVTNDVVPSDPVTGGGIETIPPIVSKQTYTATKRTLPVSGRSNVFSVSSSENTVSLIVNMTRENLVNAELYLDGSATVSVKNSTTNAVVASHTFYRADMMPWTRAGLNNSTSFVLSPGSYYLDLSGSFSYPAPGSFGNRATGWTSVEIAEINVSQAAPTGGAYKETFDIWIKDIWQGETGTVQQVWGPKIGTGEMTVMFSSGDLAGEDREFIVIKDPALGNPDVTDRWCIWEDTTKSLTTVDEQGNSITVQSKWRLTLKKNDSELKASGKQLPNVMVNAKPGDKFFFINIELPHQYVVWAEDRAQWWLEDELSRVDDEYPTFAIKPSAIFCETFTEAHLIKPGTKMRVRNVQLANPAYISLYITSLTMKFPDGKLLPEWDVTVSESVIVNRSPVAILQGEVKRLGANIYSSEQAVAQAVRQLESTFLRKDGILDVSYSPTRFTREITFDSNLKSYDFRQGDFAGSGWSIYKDSNNASVMEVDKLVVRRQMRVNEVLINQVKFTGGKQVFSAAGGQIERVEEYDTYYRCYIDTKMGTMMNHFMLDDQAYHQDFNIENNEILRYYWRRIVGVGNDYVDMSKSDADGSSIPQKGDEVAQLGNRTDVSRQSALVIDVVRDGGGLVTWFDKINLFSLVDRDSVNIGRMDGETWVKAYGNAYFGDRAGTSYQKWQNGQMFIKGTLVVTGDESDATPMAIYRGLYDRNRVYYKGEVVEFEGSSYIYINNTPSAGADLANRTYWGIFAEKGPAGNPMYTWTKYSPVDNPTASQMTDTPNNDPADPNYSRYIGLAYNKPVAEESNVPGDYTWMLFHGGSGVDGDSEQFVFRLTADPTAPTPAIENLPASQTSNYVPTGWTDNPGSVTVDLPYQWVAIRKKVNGIWGQFSPAAVWAKYGEDGQGTQYIYAVTATATAPIFTNNTPNQSDDFIPTSSGTTWYADPRGVTETMPYEWVAIRKRTGELWGAYTNPALYTRYGSDGPSLYTWTKYAPNGNPSSSQMTDTPGTTTTHIGLTYNKTTPTESNTPGDYTWILFKGADGATGKDGAFEEFIFEQTTTSTRPSTPATSQTDGYVPSGWSADPVGVTYTTPYEWVSTRKKNNGTWTAFSTPALWAKYGENGMGYEYRYHLTVYNSAPSSTSTSWTASPSGVDINNQFEWISQRQQTGENTWGAWSAAKLWAKYGQLGNWTAVVYRLYDMNEVPGRVPLPINTNPTNPGNGWSMNPPTSVTTGMAVWSCSGVAIESAPNTYAVYSWQTPVMMSGPMGSPGTGRSLTFAGNYDSTVSYYGTKELASVVLHTNGYYYYAKDLITAGVDTDGRFSGYAPTNTTYWTQFGLQSPSIASDILYARDGILGDFKFSYSARTFSSMDDDAIVLNSKTGLATFNKINANSGTIAGWALAPGRIGGTGSESVRGVSITDSYITFATGSSGAGSAFASVGVNVIPSTQYPLMATGRFEARYSEGDNHNIGIMVGARYGGKNSAIYINNGFITGFAINIRNITANTTVAHEDCYLCCYNTSRITVTLPSPSSMSIGKVVYIRLVNAGGVNISGALHTSSGPVSSDTLTTAGGGGMYVNDGTRWMFNYLQI